MYLYYMKKRWRTKKINKKKCFLLLSNWEFFVWYWEKNILFGIGNGAEFRPQNRVIESSAIISFSPFFFFDVLSTSNNSISLSSSSLNDKMGFFFAPLAFCERGAGVLASTPSISSSSLLSVFRRLLALVAAFLAINEE